MCAVFCKSLGNCFQLCLEGVQKSLWEKTCCPFPSTMYAELRTQTEAIWFECHRNVCQHTTSYLNHHHLQGRLSIWLCFDWRRRLGKLRHVLRRNHSDETRETARPRTEPSSPEPPFQEPKDFTSSCLYVYSQNPVSRTRQACQYKLQSSLHTGCLLAASPQHTPSQWSVTTDSNRPMSADRFE